MLEQEQRDRASTVTCISSGVLRCAGNELTARKNCLFPRRAFLRPTIVAVRLARTKNEERTMFSSSRGASKLPIIDGGVRKAISKKSAKTIALVVAQYIKFVQRFGSPFPHFPHTHASSPSLSLPPPFSLALWGHFPSLFAPSPFVSLLVRRRFFLSTRAVAVSFRRRV